MRWSSSRPADAALLLTLAALSPLHTTAALSCDNVEVDGHKFDFSKLKGPHSVVTTMFTPPTHKNTTYTVDICGPLKRKGDVKKGDECPTGTWACAIRRLIRGDHDDVDEVIPLAGELADQGGGALEHAATRIKTSDAAADAQPEGVRLVLNGGRFPLDKNIAKPRQQKVVIDLRCNATFEGNEGEWTPEDQYDSARFIRAARDGDEKKEGGGDGLWDDGAEHQLLKTSKPALVWNSYGADKGDANVDVLQLTWYTKYACASVADDTPADTGSHWGFFTWFVVIVFLSTAAYLIFGSWLNYSRYGASGWDLVPHSDTIRDVPYLMRDWIRRLLNTLQGSGSRGGYSAV